MDTLSKFQCPACEGALEAASGACVACGQGYATSDGILDFVRNRFATQLDVANYDGTHTIDDAGSEIEYQRFRRIAAHRWPESLGSVVEVGCGTGGFSRAMIGHRDAADAVLTDVSIDMLRLCSRHLDRLGIASAVPVRLATYSANETCFRDAAFDTCVGASVVHHIADVRGFLAAVHRLLKPGGRACFVEPSLRYHRVLAMAFADIIALLLVRDPDFSPERQALHNWVAEVRRGIMLQGDREALAAYEDKHLFIGDAFQTMALEAGFATAEALPFSPDPDGLDGIAGLLARLRVGEPFAERIRRLWPSYANRYLPLLNARDMSLGYLFWLIKGALPDGVPAPRRWDPPEPRCCSESDVTGDGMPLRWALSLDARPTQAGLQLNLGGWCIANAEIASVRVTIDGVARRAPVWLPRTDVYLALNGDGAYTAWNSLCCGADCELQFDTVHPAGEALALGVDFVFSDNCCVPIVSGETLRPGTTFITAR